MLRVFAFLLAVLLSACQSAPVMQSQKTGFSPVAADKGRVLINVFQIPRDEPGVTAFYILGAIAGANTRVPFSAAILDVTDGMHFVGRLDSGMGYGSGEWLEYDAPAGKRLFMLVSGKGLAKHADYIEVDVKAGETRALALSQYGFNKLPYFGEVNMEPGQRKHCEGIKPEAGVKLRDAVTAYMASAGINPQARDFTYYCMAVATQKVSTPNDLALQKFNESKANYVALYNETYPGWKKEAGAHQSYDLMRDYTPKSSAF